MELHCRGCAGCCLDWRPIGEVSEHERRGPRQPLDDVYNLVPLSRDDVRALVDTGLAAAMTPRLWAVESGPAVTVDGYDLAAIEGKPAFFVGLRKVPKPVGPFGTEPTWLPTCIFLDPQTLQCRVHDSEVYPAECAAYPGHNLAVGAETECERVEDAFQGTRLVDATPPDGADGPLFGPQAIGQKVFVFPEPESLSGVVDRFLDGELERADRARFIAAAAASSPGTTAIVQSAYEAVRSRVVSQSGWVQQAINAWESRADGEPPDPSLGEEIERARGAPPTPGWDADDRLAGK